MPANKRGLIALRALWVGVLSLVLASCGGGGGGSSGGGGGAGGGGSALKVSVDKTSLAWTLMQGAEPTAQVVTGTLSGSYSGTVYVLAVIANTGSTNAINPMIALQIGGSIATATIFPMQDLTPGTYAGTIDFLACADSACAQPIGGTPIHIPFTVTVKRGVAATPSPLELAATSGASTTSQVVSVVPGEGETDFTVSSIFPVFQFAEKTPSAFRVVASSVPSGDYTLGVQLTGSLGSRAWLPVHLVVAPPPGGEYSLSVQPTSLSIASSEGAIAPAQSVQVTQPSWLPGLAAPIIGYSNGMPTGWLSLVDLGGGSFSVTASAAQLSAGSYTGILIFPENVLPSPFQDRINSVGNVSVPVAFTVGAGLVRPADIDVAPGAETTLQQLVGDVPIDTVDHQSVAWQASSDALWLAVTSGPGASTLHYAIDPTWLATATNYQRYTAHVSVGVPGTSLTPVSFAINVQPRLPELSGIGPDVLASGRGNRIAAVGRGFGSLANAQSRLTISGATILGATRDSDGKLLVDLSALPAGSYTLHVGNQLGIATHPASFSVVDAPTPPAAQRSVATGQGTMSLVADSRRSQFYAVSRRSGTVLRIHATASGWLADALPLTGVTELGVLHDGSLLVATSPDVLHVIDGDTLVERYATSLPHMNQSDLMDSGIPVTADGKAWLHVSDPFRSCPTQPGAVSFDPGSQSVGAAPTSQNQCLSMINNPARYRMNRRGDLLDMEPSGLYWLDVGTGVLSDAPPSANGSGWALNTSVSDDGSRKLSDLARVTDGSGNPVGAVTLPAWGQGVTDAAFAVAGTVSHDGTRIYLLAGLLAEISQPNPAHPQRVYVLDASQVVAQGQGSLPVLGYFEIAGSTAYQCTTDLCQMAQAATSLDDRVLYLAGGSFFIELPIPQVLTPAAIGTLQPRAAHMTGPRRH